jgi:uncharacterized protein YyaL (SSP411 family)
MIAALINAGTLLGEPSWIVLAQRAFDFVAQEMTRDGRLGHSWREGRLVLPGLASDHAAMTRAALALYEATGDAGYRARAEQWQQALARHYAGAGGARYFLTADDAEGLVVRPQSTLDEAIPNHNGLIAQNLVRLATVTGEDRFRQSADALLDDLLPLATENLFAHVSPLNALDLRLRLAEIAITGNGAQAAELVAAALTLPFIDRVVVRAPSLAALPASHPARAKTEAAPEGAAFVCVGETCSLPVTEAPAIADAVAAMRRPPSA